MHLGVLVDRHAVELEAMTDEAIAVALGDLVLEPFDLLVDELDDLARPGIDQVVMVRSTRRTCRRSRSRR